MREAAEIANIPTLVLLVLWWVFLSALDFLFTPHEPSETKPAAEAPANAPAPSSVDDRYSAELRRIDPAFDAEAFLTKAGRAYEAILQAYAGDDFETLRPLLSEEVLQVFIDASRGRQSRREALQLTLVGIESARIVRAEAEKDRMEIDVLFHAQMVSAIRSEAGEIIQGDPTELLSTADLWTFSRSVTARDCQWRLVATDQG